MVVMSNDKIFSQEQLAHLSSLHFINKIDNHLRSISSVKVITSQDNIPTRVVLLLEVYYDDNKIDTLSFDLHNYDYDDIIKTASDIRSNEYILQEVDNFLAGDIE